MNEQLSPAALRMIERARYYARARRAIEVHPADLLAGMLTEDETSVVTSLRCQGVDFERLLRELAPLHFESIETDLDEATPGATPLGSAAAEVVSRAIELSIAFSRYEQASSADLLAALLETWTEGAAALHRHGVDSGAILANYHRSREPQLIPVDSPETLLRLGDSLDRTNVARILDANANRAREALRVLEDYARFAQDDSHLSALLKECRHDLRAAMEEFPAHWLLAARDTLTDVGTTIATKAEGERSDLGAVVAANCKRAQEAVRSLEEYSKIESAAAGRIFERMRYRLYTVERLLSIAGRSGERFDGVCLYWLADPDQCVGSFEWMVEQALAGGVQVLQLRDKTSNDRELLKLAREVRRWTAERGAMFIMNDRPDIARLAQADGVHVGQEELSVKDARRIVGPDAIIGVSTHDIEQARQAVLDGADYLGVGPVFPSRTKSFDQFPGLAFVGQVAREIRLPAFCIGGIDTDNVEQVLAAGASRIAVSHAINSSKDPQQVARAFRAALEG